MECAAEVVSAVDHDVTSVDSQALEVRFTLADFRRQRLASCSAGRQHSAFDLADVVAQFQSKQFVIDGHAFEFGVGVELADHASEAVVKRLGSADGVCKEQSAVVEVGLELFGFPGREIEAIASVHEDDGVSEQGGVGDGEFESARGGSSREAAVDGQEQVTDRQRRIVVASGVTQLGHLEQSTSDAVLGSTLLGELLLVELIGRFSAGGVGDHVDSDLHRPNDHRLEFDGPSVGVLLHPLVPQAREVFGGEDDHGAAAEVDSIELDAGRVGEQVFAAVDGVTGRQRFQPGVSLGVQFLDEFEHAVVETGSLAAVHREQEATLVEVLAEHCDLLIVELRDVSSGHHLHRSLQQVLNRGGSFQPVDVDDLPGHQLGPFGQRGDVFDEVPGVVTVLVPVGVVAELQLVDQDGSESFGEEQQGEARGDQLIALDPRRSPASFSLVLPVDEVLGTFAVPVVVAEEASSRESSGSFHSVEVVKQPASSSGVATHGEVSTHPGECPIELLVVGDRFAAAGLTVGEQVFFVSEHGAGDLQRGDAGDRHAAAAAQCSSASGVGPPPVAVLESQPVRPGSFPDPAVDQGTGVGGVAESEHGELPVAAIATTSGRAKRVAPQSRAGSCGDLTFLELIGECLDPPAVSAAVLGGGQGADLQ